MKGKKTDRTDPKVAKSGENGPADVAQNVDKSDTVVSLVDIEESSEYRELKDKYLRLAAEFDNYKKRNAREFSRVIETAASDLVLQILDIADDFRRAMQQESEDAAKLREGTQLIYNKLMDILQKRGVREIEAVGKQFDPVFHEAVMQQPAENVEEGQIIGEVQRGYFYNDKVLRPARVVVAAGSDDSDNPTDSDQVK